MVGAENCRCMVGDTGLWLRWANNRNAQHTQAVAPPHLGANARPAVSVVKKPMRRGSGTLPSPYSLNRYWMMASLSYICLSAGTVVGRGQATQGSVGVGGSGGCGGQAVLEGLGRHQKGVNGHKKAA